MSRPHSERALHCRMINFDGLARWLIACQKRPDADGRIVLSVADAICVRSLGFPTVVPGHWRMPPLPPELSWRYPSVAQFAADSPAPHKPSASVSPGQSPIAPAVPAGTGSEIGHHREPGPLSARLSAARTDPIRRRILDSLARHPGGCCWKRRLQQALRRIPACELNPALNRLGAAGLIVREDNWITLAPEACSLLMTAAKSVRRHPSARTLRQPDRRSQHRQRNGGGKQTRPRRYRRRPIPNRHNDPHGWALAMLGRLGGLKSQARYRARGVKATEKATRVRLVKRQRQHQQPAAAAAVTAPSPTSTPAAHDALNVSHVSTISAAGLSAAFRYNQPIGRGPRLAELRTRRR